MKSSLSGMTGLLLINEGGKVVCCSGEECIVREVRGILSRQQAVASRYYIAEKPRVVAK